MADEITVNLRKFSRQGCLLRYIESSTDTLVSTTGDCGNRSRCRDGETNKRMHSVVKTEPSFIPPNKASTSEQPMDVKNSGEAIQQPHPEWNLPSSVDAVHQPRPELNLPSLEKARDALYPDWRSTVEAYRWYRNLPEESLAAKSWRPKFYEFNLHQAVDPENLIPQDLREGLSFTRNPDSGVNAIETANGSTIAHINDPKSKYVSFVRFGVHNKIADIVLQEVKNLEAQQIALRSKLK